MIGRQRIVGNDEAVIVGEVHNVAANVVFCTDGILLPCMPVHTTCNQYALQIAAFVIVECRGEGIGRSKVFFSLICIMFLYWGDVDVQYVQGQLLPLFFTSKVNSYCFSHDIVIGFDGW